MAASGSTESIQVDFSLGGVANVMRAFESIEQRMVKFELAAARASEQGERQRTTLADREARARIASADRERRDKEQMYAGLFKQVEGREREQTRVATREARERQRTEERAAREASRVAIAATKEQERATALLAREQERAEKETAKTAERAAHERQAADIAEHRGRIARAQQAARELDKWQQETTRQHAQELSKRKALDEKAEREAEARASKAAAVRKRFAETVSGRAGAGLNNVMAGAGRLAAGLFAVGGGFTLADTVRRSFDAEQQAALLLNTTTTSDVAPKDDRGHSATVASIMARAGETAAAVGVDKTEAISGALAYSRKARGGDLGGAMANMSFFAKMAKVTGANIEDIAGAAGTLQSQNQNLDAGQMRQMLLDVYAQGKQGSMSMVDVAKQIGTLASTRSAYAGDAAANQRKLLALGQLAAPEGTVEEAGTFIKDFTMEAGKHSDDLKAMGVKFNAMGQMESPEQMIGKVFENTKGDITKISELFGVRGTALFRALQPAYAQAGGGDKGIEAVMNVMKPVTSATMTEGQLDKQHAVMMNTTAERFHAAMIRLEEDVEAKLTPYLEKFADKLPELMPHVEQFIDAVAKGAEWLGSNPWKGLGLIVAASIGKELAAEAIKTAVAHALEKAIATAMAAASGGGGPATAASGVGGLAKKAGLGAGTLAAGAAAIAATALASEQLYENANAAEQKGQKDVGQTLLDVRLGRISTEEARKRVAQARQQTSIGSIAKTALGSTGFMVDALAESVGLGGQIHTGSKERIGNLLHAMQFRSQGGEIEKAAKERDAQGKQQAAAVQKGGNEVAEALADVAKQIRGVSVDGPTPAGAARPPTPAAAAQSPNSPARWEPIGSPLR